MEGGRTIVRFEGLRSEEVHPKRRKSQETGALPVFIPTVVLEMGAVIHHTRQ